MEYKRINYIDINIHAERCRWSVFILTFCAVLLFIVVINVKVDLGNIFSDIEERVAEELIKGNAVNVIGGNTDRGTISIGSLNQINPNK